jgi:hypothetical protein
MSTIRPKAFMERLKIDEDFRNRVVAAKNHEAGLDSAKEEGCTYRGCKGLVIDPNDLIFGDDDDLLA